MSKFNILTPKMRILGAKHV